jgi:hypothetical protein
VAVKVHVQDVRILAGQVIVNGEDLEASGLELAQHRRELGLEHHQVSHRDRFAAARGLHEPGPGSERQPRLDRHASDRHAQVRSRPAVTADVSRQVLSGAAEDRVYRLPSGFGRRRREGSGERQQQRGDGKAAAFHFLASHDSR